MFFKLIILSLCSCVIFSDAAIVDTLFKCGMGDEACHTKLAQKVLTTIIEEGASEFQIPILDPYTVKLFSFAIPDLMNLKLDGVIEGMKNCIVNKFSLNFEKGYAFIDATCAQIIYDGQYKLDASSPIIKSLLGGDTIKGNGNLNLIIDDLNLKFHIFFNLKERDGKVYGDHKGKKPEIISYDVGKVTFKLDNVYLGKEDASETITDLLNNNWKFMFSTFGKEIIDRILGVGIDHLGKLFQFISVDNFISDNISHYAD